MRNNRLLGILVLALLAIGAFRSLGIRSFPLLVLIIVGIAFACGGWHAVASIGICVASLIGLVLLLAFLFGRRGRGWF